MKDEDIRKAVELLESGKIVHSGGTFLYCERCKHPHILDLKTSKKCFPVMRKFFKDLENPPKQVDK